MAEDFVLIDDYFEDFGGTTWDGCCKILESWKAVLSNTDLVVHNFFIFPPSLQLLKAYLSEKLVLTLYVIKFCPSSEHEYFIYPVYVFNNMG